MATNTKLKSCMLTTVDNPYDPFTQYDRWYAYDIEKGHNSCALLARIAMVSSSLSEEEYLAEVIRAIDFIVEYSIDPDHPYIKAVSPK